MDAPESGRVGEAKKASHASAIFRTGVFPKQNDLLHGLHLSIERYRAASYSRELSGKGWKGCAKIASSGYWAGGSPPYGTRRMLLDEKRNPVRLLELGEHKAIHNQRVRLTVSDGPEVDIIRRIFTAFGQEAREVNEIAAALNAEAIRSPGGGHWDVGSIWTILKNEIYAGNMVGNKSSQKMKSPSHPNPETDWIRAENAFDPIVPRDLFFTVQGIIIAAQLKLRKRQRGYSEGQMSETLILLQTVGGDCPEDTGGTQRATPANWHPIPQGCG